MKQANFCTDAETLMRAHSRAIVHLRSQSHQDRKRVGLIIGAGVSRGIRIKTKKTDTSLPDWPTLIQRISDHPDIQADKLLVGLGAKKGKDGTFDLRRSKKPLSSLAHIIFQHFRSDFMKKEKLDFPLSLIDERKINTAWMRIVHNSMYRDFEEKEEAYENAIKSHPYLSKLVDLIKEIPLTVNFNFDDAIERLLFRKRPRGEAMRTRGYGVVLEPSAQISRENAVVYHPNGMLPYVFEDGASPELVFSDDAFHDQISSIASGRSLLLTNYLFSNTCILLGLSLEDISLQQTLRQNAVSHPGHPHYLVQYMEDESDLIQTVRSSIFKSNFDTFGVYTIFLNDNGIAALFDLIGMDVHEFLRDNLGFAEDGVKFVYYLIGAVGVGKSTAVKYFQSLRTYDEWVDRQLPEMSRPDDELRPEERDQVDRYVVGQFGKKNFCISQEEEHIHVIDRCPLDPLTFGQEDARKQKAINLSKSMKKGKREIQKGHLLWLDCGKEEIARRKSRKHKNWPIEKIEKLLNDIDDVYRGLPASKIPTHGRTAIEVAREIAWIIFVGKYDPADIDGVLSKYGEQE